MSFFYEGRDLVVESPQEGFYIRIFRSSHGEEIRLWEVHPGVHYSQKGDQPENWIGVVTAGEFEFWLGEERKNLFPTDLVEISDQVPYRFRVVGEKTARMILMRRPDSKQLK